MEMSKSDFAAHIGVSPGRITQMISSGIIGADALAGEGRGAKIIAEIAKRQIADRRHPGQAMGNGLQTRLETDDDEDLELPMPPAASGLTREDPAKQILIERLEQERRKNRQASVEEARANGQLVAGEELQRQVAKATQTTVNIFTGMAPDIANAIAAKFSLPQRDVLHLVRQVMRDKQAAAAGQLKVEAAVMPETTETELA